MNYQELAKNILSYVGNSDNVDSVTHCATRLRFHLNDEQKVNEESLKKLKGVLGLARGGGQFQVIIGQDVSHVYDELNLLLEEKGERDNSSSKSTGDKKSWVSTILDTISGIFTPILPAITGAAMMKTLLILLTLTNVLTTESQTYLVLSFVGDVTFYFLPIFLAYSAAQNFKMNPYIAMMLGGILLHPTFVGMVAEGTPVKLFGFLPVTLAQYSSTVIPIILTVWIGSYVERFADKVSPKSIRFFLKPFLVLLIMTPITLSVVAPSGFIVGEWLGMGITAIQNHALWLLPFIFGIFSPVFIMTGMHYAVTIPLVLQSIADNGFDMLGIGYLVANVAQAGAVFAVARLTKNTDFKALANSSGVTALLGISEPAIYGVNLKLKKPFIAVMIAGGIGGLITGIAGVKRMSFAPTGITTLPIFIDPGNMWNFIFAIVGSIASFVIAFMLTTFIVSRDEAIMKEIN